MYCGCHGYQEVSEFTRSVAERIKQRFKVDLVGRAWDITAEDERIRLAEWLITTVNRLGARIEYEDEW